MNIKDLMPWLDRRSGLEIRKNEFRTNENPILFFAEYISLLDDPSEFKELAREILTAQLAWSHRYYMKLKSKGNVPKWMIPVGDYRARVKGLSDRCSAESLKGSPNQYYDLGEPGVREDSRDNIFARIYLSLLFDLDMHTDIADMFIRTQARMPNHNISAVKNPFQGNAWANFNFQFLWDGYFILAMSDRKWHNFVAKFLFPFYCVAQLFVAREEVERHGKKEPKNSGDCLLHIRQLCFELKFGKRLGFADDIMVHKWDTISWHIPALYEYHDWRNHNKVGNRPDGEETDFPITERIKEIWSEYH